MTELTIASRYRLESPIGSGGGGSVFEATDLTLQAKRAVKILPARVASEPVRSDAFLAEARVAAQFDGKAAKHVVTVYDVVMDGTAPALVMERLRGEDLAARIRRRGAVSPTAVIRIVDALAIVLDEAHIQKQIAHGDLKPENLFLVDPDDHLKVLDFGVAASLHGSATCTPYGTPSYMAPERFRTGEQTAATDIWSIGMIVFVALTGRQPWRANGTAKLIEEILNFSTDSLPERLAFAGFKGSADLLAWWDRALAKNPVDRFTKASDAAEALRRALESSDALEQIPSDASPVAESPDSEPAFVPLPVLGNPLLGEPLSVWLARAQGWQSSEVHELLRALAICLDDHPLGGRASSDLVIDSFRLRREHGRFEATCHTSHADATMSPAQRLARTVTSARLIDDLGLFPPDGEERRESWLIAVVAFKALTGKNFWRGMTPVEVLESLKASDTPSASERAAELGKGHKVPPSLDAWFQRCLSKTAADRCVSASHAVLLLADEFESFVEPPEREPEIEKVPRPPPLPIVIGATLIVGLIVGLGAGTLQRTPIPQAYSALDGVGGLASRAVIANSPDPSHWIPASNPWVRLGSGAYIQQTEVARGPYALLSGLPVPLPDEARQPVTEVSFADARAFCRRIGGDLPSTEVWLEAAAGGAWADAAEQHPSANHMHEVGSLAVDRSPAGIFDLAGNVSEWVQTSDGAAAVLGPSYGDPAERARALIRTAIQLTEPSSRFLGFRCARMPGTARH